MIKKLYVVLSEFENWFPLTDGRGFEEQLKNELVEGHSLFGMDLFAIGKSELNDDVLFVSTTKYYVIHLTWGFGSEKFPMFEEFEELTDLIRYLIHSQKTNIDLIDII